MCSKCSKHSTLLVIQMMIKWNRCFRINNISQQQNIQHGHCINGFNREMPLYKNLYKCLRWILSIEILYWSSSVVKRNNDVYLSGMLMEQQYNTLLNDGKQLIFAMTFFPLHGKRPFLRELRLKTVLMIYTKHSHTRSSNVAPWKENAKNANKDGNVKGFR